MTMKPCIYCPHSRDCDIRREKSAAISGLGITTMTFKCQRIRDEFRPGSQVRFNVNAYDISPSGDDVCETPITLTGWIMKWKGHKLVVVVDSKDDELTTERNPINLWPSDCTLTGETRRSCIHCGKPEGVEIEKRGRNGDMMHNAEPWSCRFSPGEYDWCGRETAPAEELECEYA